MRTADPPPALWVVVDGDGLPMHSAPWPEACHEYINEALDRDHREAADWRVRLYFLAEVQPS